MKGKQGGKEVELGMNRSPEEDIKRAKELRKLAKMLSNPAASRSVEATATRLEARAAKNLNKLARPHRKGVKTALR